MKRRNFLATTFAASSLSLNAAEKSSEAPVPVGVMRGKPLISGPNSCCLAIIQAVNGPATGYAEISINEGAWQKIQQERNGLLTYETHVLKFLLPPIPAGAILRYRVKVSPVDFSQSYSIKCGVEQASEIYSIKTLDPSAHETRFCVWNDTHENLSTIQALHDLTTKCSPDFLLWNGDQTNNVLDIEKMAEQYICPGALPIASGYPLAYLRGNHDVRGREARLVEKFTHSPGADFTYGFRSGPVACLCMDTGEDKPDDHPLFAGLAGFDLMRKRQTIWLEKIIQEPWFQSAPYKILFCHIPLWWTDEVTNFGYYWFHKPCREAWLPLLVKAGIQLVVSGHTHAPAHLPVTDQRPIPQLIGGGPKPEIATLTEFVATKENLTITMKKLNGNMIHSLVIKPA
jgi:acid phosphatase type 7